MSCQTLRTYTSEFEPKVLLATLGARLTVDTMLPPDIYHIILVEHLAEDDLVSLGRCTSVCKLWCKIITAGSALKALRSSFARFSREPGLTLFLLCSSLDTNNGNLYLDHNITPPVGSPEQPTYYCVDRIGLVNNRGGVAANFQDDGILLCQAKGIQFEERDGWTHDSHEYKQVVHTQPPFTAREEAVRLCFQVKDKSQCLSSMYQFYLARPTRVQGHMDLLYQHYPLLRDSVHTVAEQTSDSNIIWAECALTTPALVETLCCHPPSRSGEDRKDPRVASSYRTERHRDQLKRIHERLQHYNPNTREHIRRLRQLHDMLSRVGATKDLVCCV